MNLKIIFSKLGMSPSKKKVMKIAKNYDYNEDGNEISVIFNEINNDLKNIFNLMGGWKSQFLEIDGKIVDFREFESVMNCYEKNRCKGVCLLKFRFLDSLESKWEIKKNIAYVNSRWSITDLFNYSSFVQQEDNKTFILDKNKLKEEILKDNTIVFDYCNKVNIDKINEAIDKLPNKFMILSLEDQRIQHEKEREKRLKHIEEEREEREKQRMEELKNKKFEGFFKYEKELIRAKSKIMAEEIAKELKKLMKK